MQIHMSIRHDDLVAFPRRDVAAAIVDGEVGRRNSEFGLEQSLVDGAELAYAKRAEVDRAGHTLGGIRDQERSECGFKDVVRQ